MRKLFLAAAALLALTAVAPAQDAGDKIPLSAGFPADSSALFATAAANDAYGEEGLALTVQNFNDVAATRNALVAGQVEVASIGLAPALQGLALGVPLKLLGGTVYSFVDSTGKSWESTVVAAREDRDIASVTELAGKRIAINSLGGTYYLALRQKLLSEGLDPNGMTFLAMPFSQMGGALVTGEVDVAVMLRTDFVRTQERQALREIMTEAEFTGNDISTATLIVAKADWLEQNEDKIVALLKAFLKTNLFMQEDRLNNGGAATIAALDEYVNLPEGVAKLYYEVRGGYAGLELDYVNWMEIPRDAVDTYNRLLQEGDMLQGREPVPYEQAVDSSYLRKAHAELGIEWKEHEGQ